jgi:methionyl-tRNA formyltransferase
MRIVFAGTSDFAVPALRAANARHDVAAVVTQPDRPGHRGTPAPRPVADAAGSLGLPVLQPERIRDPGAAAQILELGADALVVAAYGQIIPAALLDGHRHGGVNVHASLLPRWRGASPVAHAILHGDAETGVCIMRMEAGLDTGPVYACRRIAIAEDATTPALTEELAIAGAEELVGVLAQLERGRGEATPQPDDGVTYAPRLRRTMGRVNWAERSAREVDRMVRALTPWPGVVAPLAGAEVAITSGRVAPDTAVAAPGEVVTTGAEHADVATREGVFRVEQVKPPGRREMAAAAFLRGRH